MNYAMSGLRIAIIVKTNVGGAWVATQAATLRDRGHEPIVVLPAGPGRLTERLHEIGVRTVPSPFSFRFRPTPATVRQLWQLRRLLRELRPDVVNHHLYAAALAARIASLGLGFCRVHTVVGPLFLESPVIRAVERVLCRLDHLVICGTAYTSRLYGELGLSSERRPAVTVGVDISRYRPPSHRDRERAKARADLGLPLSGFVVIMVAFVYPPRWLGTSRRGIKGHDVLLAAWRSFRARRPDAHLLLVGGGTNRIGVAHRDELIRRFDVIADPSVTWLNSVEDVRPAYRAANLSVSPSLSEGHGAPVEASAMSVPSVVSDAGGLPETVDGRSGWVVPRDDVDALAEGLEVAYREYAAGRLDTRGDHARRYAEQHFDRQRAEHRMVDLIEEAVERHAPDRPRRPVAGTRRSSLETAE
ncbi:glycosyltransferase family 4 protein [Micromonospora sp. DT227]|uniref:glycosyltransferase family 4 protein n=1 Tax=Micromonospora sp. DT227 TaxID=3393433 RepID=UPI003CEE9D57